MLENQKDKDLKNIDEIIAQARKLGVDFGNGDPRNRLRYYTKIGLLPHAQRKSFNNNQAQGAYPEHVVGLLVEIARKIKEGKSIQALKREIIEKEENTEKRKEEREEAIFKNQAPSSLPPQIFQRKAGEGKPIHTYTYHIKPSYLKTAKSASLSSFSQLCSGKIASNPPRKTTSFFNFSASFRPAFIFIILALGTIIFTNAKIDSEDLIPYFSAAVSKLNKIGKLAQLPVSPLPAFPGSPEEPLNVPLIAPFIEPYLTINAETAINSSLNVRDSISSPRLILTKGDFGGTLAVSDLTSDRTYTFPNQTGTVCLSTGNCVGVAGEVFSPGGTPNRLAKFITSRRIGDSSINDLYAGILITISPTGNVGVGTVAPEAKLDVAGGISASGVFVKDKVGIGIKAPTYELQVKGRIQATGDICTDLRGGRCLSQILEGRTIFWGGGISGGGDAGYISVWDTSNSLENSVIYQSSSKIGIGTTAPAQKLDVSGTIKMTGFALPTGAASGYVLTSDGSGIGTWQAASGTVPMGTVAGQTLRYSGSNWLVDSFLYNSGSAIGIGTTSSLATLTLNGDGFFKGPLTIATSTFPQLILKYDDNNYLRFSINDSRTELLSSKTMVIDSLTGEVKLASGVISFNATSSTIRGLTFISADSDSTVRKSGELVLRSSAPIFRFPVPAQTTSTDFTRISDYFSGPLDFFPSALAGSTRKYAFLMNFADNIATTSQSEWRIYRPVAASTTATFYFSGQNLSSLAEGVPHISGVLILPSNDWQLEVRIPATSTIRIFNIFLLAYDQIN